MIKKTIHKYLLLQGFILAHFIAPIIYIIVKNLNIEKIKFKKKVILVGSGPSLDLVKLKLINQNYDIIFINGSIQYKNFFNQNNRFFFITNDIVGLISFKKYLQEGNVVEKKIKKIVLLNEFRFVIIKYLFDKSFNFFYTPNNYIIKNPLNKNYKNFFFITKSRKLSSKYYGGFKPLRMKPKYYDNFFKNKTKNIAFSAPYTSLLSALKFVADRGAREIISLGFDCCEMDGHAKKTDTSITLKRIQYYRSKKKYYSLSKLRLVKINLWSAIMLKYLSKKNINWTNFSPKTCIKSVPKINSRVFYGKFNKQ